MLVSICVTTYKRPLGLTRLLQGLTKLTFHKVERPEIEVIIIDNDTQGIGREICQEFQTDFPWILKTDVESTRGITYGRNKSLDLADPNTDAIAILDDDEVPQPSWLDELLWVQQEYQADIVTGPALPCFESKEVPQWIIEGRFLEPPRYSTGESRHVAFTNNVLIKAEILKQYNPVFDNRFALTGAEDSHLFMRLHKAGYKIVWADEAIVEDWIPQARTTSKWILERYYHSWSVHSLLEKELNPSLTIQFVRLLKGITLIVIGIIKFFPTLILGKHGIFSSLLYMYKGAGTLAGLLGIQRQEYKVVNTDSGLSR